RHTISYTLLCQTLANLTLTIPANSYHRTSTTDIAALATAAHHHGSRHRRSPSRPPSQPHSGKGGGAPLAFRCIKGMGGPVPSTLIGVTRIYPVLYRESLPKYESSHEFQTKKKRQQQRQNEEMAKRQKLQHPQQHARLIACFCRHDKEGNAGFVVFEFVDYALHPCPAVWLRNTSFLMRATS
ncbi:hypothetical protein HYC85_016617, partial [Camellia sinensis]